MPESMPREEVLRRLREMTGVSRKASDTIHQELASIYARDALALETAIALLTPTEPHVPLSAVREAFDVIMTGTRKFFHYELDDLSDALIARLKGGAASGQDA